MKVGILFNPGAGKREFFCSIGENIRKGLENCEVLTGSTIYGGNYIDGAYELPVSQEADFTGALGFLLKSFIKSNVELIIGVGGDGFLSHIAGFMIENKCGSIPLMGIAGGTANIGPLLKFNSDNLKDFDVKKLLIENTGSIQVVTGGKCIGYAFNDVILGDTFLGTINGEMKNLSAGHFIKCGQKVIKSPGDDIVSSNFGIYINNRKCTVKSDRIAQVMISPLYKRGFYSGKAVSGALCLADYFKKGACIGICDTVLVDSALTGMDNSIVIEHKLFDVKDTVKIQGIKENTYVVIDGNVFECKEGKLQLRYFHDCIKSVILK